MSWNKNNTGTFGFKLINKICLIIYTIKLRIAAFEIKKNIIVLLVIIILFEN